MKQEGAHDAERLDQTCVSFNDTCARGQRCLRHGSARGKVACTKSGDGVLALRNGCASYTRRHSDRLWFMPMIRPSLFGLGGQQRHAKC